MAKGKRRSTGKRNERKDGRHPCPICGQTMFREELSNDICKVCGWEDDVLICEEESEDSVTGANEMGLLAYREAYQSGWRPDWILARQKREQ